MERLGAYSNYLEIQTLSSLLGADYEKILESDDSFCIKILLSNLEKSNFEQKFMELKAKQGRKK